MEEAKTIVIGDDFKHIDALSKGLTPYSPEVISRLVEHDMDCAPIDDITALAKKELDLAIYEMNKCFEELNKSIDICASHRESIFNDFQWLESLFINSLSPTKRRKLTLNKIIKRHH